MSGQPGESRAAGLRAVARVRAVRERDSRIGLQQALREQRLHADRAAEARHRIENAESFSSCSAASFLALRASLDALGEVLRDADEQAATSRTVSEAAYGHWLRDKTRLSAVELLLERREELRRVEALRLGARDLDELAAQMWQRREATKGDRR
jgi:flagellar biosynthesis chaperone FliJ